MNILICGADGFLGRHITVALQQAGHHVIRGIRNLGLNSADIAIDYCTDTDPATWLQRLKALGQVDFIINAVGLLHESGSETYARIHRDAPLALFRAAEEYRVQGIIQISALGGDAEHQIHPDSTAFLHSKREADADLRQGHSPYLILRPSLVVGLDGASSRVFRMLASLPLTGIPGNGEQQLQPVHINDICLAITNWIQDQDRHSQIVNAVGATPMSYRQMLLHYRQAMQLGSSIQIRLALPLLRAAAGFPGVFSRTLLSAASLQMLEKGNVADATDFTRLLGQAPKSAAQWFSGTPASMLAAEAIDMWMQPLFRCMLACIWIMTGLLSAGIYPQRDSLALLAPLHLNGLLSLTVLYGACALDLVIGLATLCKFNRFLWLLQIVLILFYSVLIAVYLPEFYLHPFGPILKNLSILAMLVYLYSHATEKRK